MVRSMSEQRVSVEHDGHVAVVTLTRPEKHNALDGPMFEGILAAAAEVAAAPGVRAVVVHGEGPSFCSGLDIASLMTGPVSLDDILEREPGQKGNAAQRVATDWIDLPMPVIAAIHGNCFGGGLQLALGADIRIAAPDAKLSVLEVKWGLVPDMGITSSLPRILPADVAKELTYTGRVVSGAEAAALGLVTRTAADPLAGCRARREEALRHRVERPRRRGSAAGDRPAAHADRLAEPDRGGDRGHDEAARGVRRPGAGRRARRLVAQPSTISAAVRTIRASPPISSVVTAESRQACRS